MNASYSHTRTNGERPPSNQSARQEQLGVRCLAQGHFDTPRAGGGGTGNQGLQAGPSARKSRIKADQCPELLKNRGAPDDLAVVEQSLMQADRDAPEDLRMDYFTLRFTGYLTGSPGTSSPGTSSLAQ